jgi:hypothetical protein
MNPKTLAVMAARALAQLFTLQGDSKAAESLTFVANGIESGLDVDEHMQSVADALNAGSPVSWDDVTARIEAEAAELRSR